MSADFNIEVTGLASSSGPLTKRISLSPEGKLISDGSACLMSYGAARRVRLGGVADFAALIDNLESNEAIALGSLRADLPDTVEITTAKRLAELSGRSQGVPKGVIARTAGHINYAPKVPAFAWSTMIRKGSLRRSLIGCVIWAGSGRRW